MSECTGNGRIGSCVAGASNQKFDGEICRAASCLEELQQSTGLIPSERQQGDLEGGAEDDRVVDCLLRPSNRHDPIVEAALREDGSRRWLLDDTVLVDRDEIVPMS